MTSLSSVLFSTPLIAPEIHQILQNAGMSGLSFLICSVLRNRNPALPCFDHPRSLKLSPERSSQIPRLQRFHRGQPWNFRSASVAGDLPVRRHVQAVAESGGPSQLFHQRLANSVKRIASRSAPGSVSGGSSRNSFLREGDRSLRWFSGSPSAQMVFF